ncbi:MAG TPA: HEPN domain-containing protein [Thermodesulfovibrionales bacterium]|nr:HEPN domain-containing protein [Thermodesulfovibrionales bacterium]
MKHHGNRDDVIDYWIGKSTESLESADDELKAGRLSFAVNRIYYSCFYIVSALLLQNNLKFRKHSGIRAAFHRNFIKPGILNREHGLLYDELFEARQRGDYLELVSFEKGQVEDWLEQAEGFIESVNSLIGKNE